MRKTFTGVVVSDKADKTVSVRVTRRFAHPLYGKVVTRSQKYAAHDESNEFRTGDEVEIAAVRPISKTKTWKVTRLLARPKGIETTVVETETDLDVADLGSAAEGSQKAEAVSQKGSEA